MIKILITAFEPFGKDTENAAAIVCEKLTDRTDRYQAEKRILPTEFVSGAHALLQAMDEVQPEMVICLGQAGGRTRITPERVAINLMDASIPDNAGYQPDEEVMVPGGPQAYFTNVPVKAVVRAAQEAGYPATVSNTAGAYVCNCIFYTLMNRIAYTPANETQPAVWGDFIHIPYLTEQQGKPENVDALPLAQVTETVQFLIDELARRKERKTEAYMTE